MTNDWNHHFSRLRGISRTQRKPPVVRGFANEQTRGSVKSQATHRQRTVTEPAYINISRPSTSRIMYPFRNNSTPDLKQKS